MKISAVVNTHNEARNITRCLESIVPYVSETVIVDMQSTDETQEKAKKFTAKIWNHKYMGYVEPARNFAISKAQGDWILLIDADEILPETLGVKLRRLAEHGVYTYYRLPRRNLIFGRWIRHCGWWPDYQIRFFKKRAVVWNDEIHSLPLTYGKGMDLIAEEKNAFTHYHYENVDQYLERLNRYTSQEAKQLVADGYIFCPANMLLKPGSEFLTRFYAWEGYKDGIHGMALSLLQAFSFLIVELKVWEQTNFSEKEKSNDEIMSWFQKIKHDTWYWHFTKKSLGKNGILQLWYKIRAKLNL